MGAAAEAARHIFDPVVAVAVALILVVELSGHTFDPAADIQSESQSTHLRDFRLFQHCSNRAAHVAIGSHPRTRQWGTPWARAGVLEGADRRGGCAAPGPAAHCSQRHLPGPAGPAGGRRAGAAAVGRAKPRL